MDVGVYVGFMLRRVGGPDGGRVADWVLKQMFRLDMKTGPDHSQNTELDVP